MQRCSGHPCRGHCSHMSKEMRVWKRAFFYSAWTLIKKFFLFEDSNEFISSLPPQMLCSKGCDLEETGQRAGFSGRGSPDKLFSELSGKHFINEFESHKYMLLRSNFGLKLKLILKPPNKMTNNSNIATAISKTAPNGSHIFHFWGNFCANFHGYYTNLHFHQQGCEFSLSPHTGWYLLLSFVSFREWARRRRNKVSHSVNWLQETPAHWGFAPPEGRGWQVSATMPNTCLFAWC